MFCAYFVEAQIWNSTLDYSSSNNPNGTWSYGRKWIPQSSSFDIFTVQWGSSGWYFGNVGHGGPSIQSGPLLWSKNNTNGLPVVRWTCPFTGNFNLSSFYIGADSRGVDVVAYITLNNNIIFSDTIQANLDSTQLLTSNFNLSQNDNLDFIIKWNGGVNSEYSWTKLITIISNSAPSPAGVITGLNSVCQGSQSIIYKVPPIAGATTYIWTLPSGFSGISNSDSIIVDISTSALSGNITVKGHNNDGDGIASSLFVTVNETPVISFFTSPSPAMGCEPLDVSFADESTPQNLNFLWSFGDGATSNIQNPSHIYYSAGSYNVQLTCITLQGCYSSYIANNFVNVYSQPIAEFTWNPPIASPNTAVTFTNISTLANDYFWDFGDGTNSINQNPIHTFYSLGEYNVSLISQNSFGCIDSVYHQITITQTGLTEINTNKVNLVLDNSSKILYMNNFVHESVISIFDISGKLILSQSITENAEKINIKQFAKGMYIIRISNDIETIVSKFVKE
jgi:PKD repeat protein